MACRFLCCTCGKKKSHKELYKHHGMVDDKHRKCTDVLCLILFLVFWIGMIVIASVGFAKGDVKRLIYGSDYRGETCGKDDLSDKKLITYPRYTEDYVINLDVTNPLDYQFYGICVSSCPDQNEVICNLEAAITSRQEAFPAAYTQENMLACLDGSYVQGSVPDFSCPETGSNPVKENCWITPVDTASVFFRCIPVKDLITAATTVCTYPANITDPNDPECILAKETSTSTLETPAQQNLLFEKLGTLQAVWSRYFGDVQRSWYVIVACGVVVALVISFFWLVIVKWCTWFMVWFTIFLMMCVMIALTFFCYFKAGILEPEDIEKFTDRLGDNSEEKLQDSLETSENNKDKWKYAAYIFTAASIIMLCLIVALRSSINTAIEVIKLGARAISKAWGTVFYPIVTVLLLFGLVVYWVFVAAALVSAGDIRTTDVTNKVANELARFDSPTLNASATIRDNFQYVDENDITKWLLLYHFFGLLWTNQFIQGVGVCTIAGAVCGWYFSHSPQKQGVPKELQYNQPKMPVCASFKRTCRYNLGSIAFGSLLIAIIQFVRAILAYIQRQSEKANRNQFVKTMLCCLQCCLKVLQTIAEVVTRNAFVFVALKGMSFCSAGRQVFSLIFDNTAVFAIVNVLGEIIMIMGKVVVAVTCGFCSYWILQRTDRFKEGGEDELTSTWLPVLLTMATAYMIAAGFFYVYDVAVDSMLVCFVVDKQENRARHNDDAAFDRPIHFKPTLITDLIVVDDETKEKVHAAESRDKSSANPTAGGTYEMKAVNPGPAM